MPSPLSFFVAVSVTSTTATASSAVRGGSTVMLKPMTACRRVCPVDSLSSRGVDQCSIHGSHGSASCHGVGDDRRAKMAATSACARSLRLRRQTASVPGRAMSAFRRPADERGPHRHSCPSCLARLTAGAAMSSARRTCSRSTRNSTFVMSGRKKRATVQSRTIRRRRSHRGIWNK